MRVSGVNQITTGRQIFSDRFLKGHSRKKFEERDREIEK